MARTQNRGDRLGAFPERTDRQLALMRFFKSLTGMTISQFVEKYRRDGRE